MQKEITDQEIADFIMNQDPDKEINMDESNSQDKCGCLGVQFVKANFGFNNFQVGCSGVFSGNDSACANSPWNKFVFDNWDWKGTYREIQENIKKNFPEFIK